MDSDGDGRRDRVHVDVSRPTETETDGLKVPVIYEDSPNSGAPIETEGAVAVIDWLNGRARATRRARAARRSPRTGRPAGSA